MRLGISTSVIQRGKTGVAQYVFGLLQALLSLKEHHPFTLFVLEDDLALFDFARNQVEIVSVPERFRPAAKNILWHQTRLPRLARNHGLDVLHIPSYRRMLWSATCASVATIHDLAPFHVQNKYDWKRMFYGRVIARRLAARQDHIIAISENTARDLRRFFHLPSQRITVIHNGIDHRRFHPDQTTPSGILKKYALQPPFFLYVARLEHPGKNHVRLISAFEEFKAATRSEWRLVFAGSDWNGAEFIHAAVRTSPFATDIQSLGFVPDHDLPDLYRAAGAFVYPSLYEGFGFPPLEAMACGCPAITSTRGSLGEVVGRAAALVDPEDIHSIAKQLYILSTDVTARNQFRAAGLAQADLYDWSRTANETMRLYERAFTDSRNGARR